MAGSFGLLTIEVHADLTTDNVLHTSQAEDENDKMSMSANSLHVITALLKEASRLTDLSFGGREIHIASLTTGLYRARSLRHLEIFEVTDPYPRRKAMHDTLVDSKGAPHREVVLPSLTSLTIRHSRSPLHDLDRFSFPNLLELVLDHIDPFSCRDFLAKLLEKCCNVTSLELIECNVKIIDSLGATALALPNIRQLKVGSAEASFGIQEIVQQAANLLSLHVKLRDDIESAFQCGSLKSLTLDLDQSTDRERFEPQYCIDFGDDKVVALFEGLPCLSTLFLT